MIGLLGRAKRPGYPKSCVHIRPFNLVGRAILAHGPVIRADILSKSGLFIGRVGPGWPARRCSGLCGIYWVVDVVAMPEFLQINPTF